MTEHTFRTCQRSFSLVRLTPVCFLVFESNPKAASLLNQHGVTAIKAFCRAHVYEWTENRLTVHLTWGYGALITCDVEEFKPLGNSLLYQNQYKKNLETGGLDLVRSPSPPLGMTLIRIGPWRAQLLAYLDRLLEEDFAGFPEACYRGADCKVQRELLLVLHRHYTVTKNVSHRTTCPDRMLANNLS